MFSNPARDALTSPGSGEKKVETVTLGRRKCVLPSNLDLRVRSGCLHNYIKEEFIGSSHQQGVLNTSKSSLPSFVALY